MACNESPHFKTFEVKEDLKIEKNMPRNGLAVREGFFYASPDNDEVFHTSKKIDHPEVLKILSEMQEEGIAALRVRAHGEYTGIIMKPYLSPFDGAGYRYTEYSNQDTVEVEVFQEDLNLKGRIYYKNGAFKIYLGDSEVANVRNDFGTIHHVFDRSCNAVKDRPVFDDEYNYFFSQNSDSVKVFTREWEKTETKTKKITSAQKCYLKAFYACECH